MARIEIIYDFDPASFEYYKKGLNEYPSLQFSRNEELFFPIEEIRKRKNIECLNHLGTGLDKLCIMDSKSKRCFMLEPCSAAYFICSIEETFKYFIQEINLGKTSIENGGIHIGETSYRVNREHKVAGESDIWAGITLKLINENWKISFGKVLEEPILELAFESFLSAYFDFAKRMKRFYDEFIPQFQMCEYQYAIFNSAVEESVINEKFNWKSQSSFDKLTYYDYQ